MTATRIHLALGALFGAAGVALLAAGAHVAGSLVTTAAQMLLFHAPAIMAAAVARKSGFLESRVAQPGLALMMVGVAVFSGDLAMREFAGTRLFAMAAPVGGAMTIASWVMLALSAIVRPPKN